MTRTHAEIRGLCHWPTTVFALIWACASAGAADEEPIIVVAPDSVNPPAQSPAVPDQVDQAALRAFATETVAAMLEAQAAFAEGRVSDETQAQQAGILERLQRLADWTRRQSQTITAGQATGVGARPANSGDGQGAAGRQSAAADSRESANSRSDGEVPALTTTRDLATSVWGHLPTRQRDRMQSRFSEQFLPQYEQLVRQYYERLATESAPPQ